MGLINFITAHSTTLLLVVVALDNLLAEIPAINANSTFQLFTTFLRKEAPKS